MSSRAFGVGDVVSVGITSVTERMRTLVVGGGSIGERHIRCFLATGRCDVGLCESSAARRAELGQRYPLAFNVASLSEACEHAAQLAVVATPADLHVDQSLALAERGMHLLIEKPLSTNLAGIERLQAVVADRALVAGVAYVYRVHPALLAMHAMLASGRWGAPRQLIVVAGQHFPTFRPQYREIYYADRHRGGGAIQDALTHLLDFGQWLAGPIEKLCADADHQVLAGVEVEDTVSVITRQAGALGTYTLNQYQGADELTLTIVCERGMCRFENHASRWRWMDGIGGEWRDEPFSLPDRDFLYQRQANAFLDATEKRISAPCTLTEGLSALLVCQAVLESWCESRWIRPKAPAEASPPPRS